MKKSTTWIRTKINILIYALSCILICSVLFAGATFAWFMDIVLGQTDPLKFASLDVESQREPQVVNDIDMGTYPENYFLNAAIVGLNQMFNSFNDATFDATAVNDEFKKIWNDYSIGGRLLPPIPGNLGLGGIIRKEYTLINKSSIAVYLRLPAPEVKGKDVNGDIITDRVASAYFINWQDDNLVYGNTTCGYTYWLKPLKPFGDPNGEDRVTFEVIEFLPVVWNHTIANLSKAEILYIEYADIIQTGNNAVFFVDGWREVAELGLFIPYDDY